MLLQEEVEAVAQKLVDHREQLVDSDSLREEVQALQFSVSKVKETGQARGRLELTLPPSPQAAAKNLRRFLLETMANAKDVKVRLEGRIARGHAENRELQSDVDRAYRELEVLQEVREPPRIVQAGHDRALSPQKLEAAHRGEHVTLPNMTRFDSSGDESHPAPFFSPVTSRSPYEGPAAMPSPPYFSNGATPYSSISGASPRGYDEYHEDEYEEGEDSVEEEEEEEVFQPKLVIPENRRSSRRGTFFGLYTAAEVR